ncbi:sensor histidine kinase [Knoellia sp. Soil729]|uniref:sensor histidine kinase n=1 Tax=Knoellia sp. Soil729 TaxID=1736394 RepID=UPI0006F5936E|nr:histidine kinase [Knoellia sp. Soil729]KRE42166.1 hypothetical protein ASG74_06810 [Knoellia sp. Soil729]
MALHPDRGRKVAGWMLAALVVLLYATVPLSLSGDVISRPSVTLSPGGVSVGLILGAFALSGAFLTHARPRNAIGWIIIGSGLLQAVNRAADAYSARALTDPDGSLPWGLPAAWLASWSWMPSLLVPVLILPALYPTGRAPSPYWRWHVRLASAGIALTLLVTSVLQGGVDDSVAGTSLPWTTPDWVSWVLGVPAAVLVGACALNVVVGTVVRAARSSSPERQQLLWLIGVVALMVATFVDPFHVMFGFAYGLLPVAVVVGVLRYRLLGIQVALRRTLLYVPLTILVALVVGGMTTGLSELVPEGPVPLLLSSAVAAVVVIFVAQRLRVRVDRFVLGPESDPLALVDRVAAGLEIEHADPVASMLEAVASAVGAGYAAVLAPHGAVTAAVGHPADDPAQVRLPLRHSGVDLGELVVGGPAGTPLPEGGLRLTAALAPHLAVVVEATRLAVELDRERERVTTATLTERDRLRRDLHDGLGPSLSGIALGLEATALANETNPGAVPALLARTRQEADSAVAEIRRVLDGLRPAALDLSDLPGAVRSTATMLGLGRTGSAAFELVTDPISGLSPRVEEAAYRIVAESLTNVVRHAGATRCIVRLVHSDNSLQVLVTDDGRGPGAGRASGHGVESMRRRAVDIGGTLAIGAAAAGGTTVSAVLPLEGP